MSKKGHEFYGNQWIDKAINKVKVGAPKVARKVGIYEIGAISGMKNPKGLQNEANNLSYDATRHALDTIFVASKAKVLGEHIKSYKTKLNQHNADVRLYNENPLLRPIAYIPITRNETRLKAEGQAYQHIGKQLAEITPKLRKNTQIMRDKITYYKGYKAGATASKGTIVAKQVAEKSFDSAKSAAEDAFKRFFK
jgi:hypothetical protein